MLIPIDKRWINEVGPVEVDRILDCKRSGVTGDLSVPPKGVLHTTEGGRLGSISVFRNVTGTPTFGCGRDVGLHVDQFMPIGEMSLTLQNDSGGTETNREARVQIEVYGFARNPDKAKWMLDTEHKEMDEANKNLLADLVHEASRAANIPLRHVSNPNRKTSVWDSQAGWYGHQDVPENDHWDPGNFDWDDMFLRGQRWKFRLMSKDGKEAESSVVRGNVVRSAFAKFIANKSGKYAALAMRGKRPRFTRIRVR